LSRLLQDRFRVSGTLLDIDSAIAETDRALASLPDGHDLRRPLASELANALNLRFQEFGNYGDISRAIQICENLAAHPDLHPLSSDADDRLTPQVNLAVGLLDRYYRFKDPKDLSQSIDLLSQIVSDTPSGSSRRLLRVNNLCSALYFAFRDTSNHEALNRAINLQREVAKTNDAVFRVHAVTAPARLLDAAAGDASAAEATMLFREACRAGLELNVGAAMWAGMMWGELSWERHDLDAAGEAYSYSARGAQLLFSRQTGESEKQIRLHQFREVAPRAAFALAHQGRLEEAALAFELSRAQLMRQAIDRGQTLYAAPNLDANVQTTTAVASESSHPAFDIAEIKTAAQEVPLVYLIYTERGGLALVVRHGRITQVPLPDL
jgi:hypothetical protein